MLSSEAALAGGVSRRLRIGIGLRQGSDKAGSAAGSPAPVELVAYHDAKSMCIDLRDGKIDAAVRGELPSNEAMSCLKDTFSLESTQRMALIEPIRGGLFLLGPVGIDEGRSPAEKEAMALAGHSLMRSLGGRGKVGLMSCGRESDRGRSGAVDRSMDEALLIRDALRGQGVEASHVQITIESALEDHDVIIAPDGIIGNILFRALHFLGGAKALGAPVVNMQRIFIDTSRAKEDYSDSIALAQRLATEAER